MGRGPRAESLDMTPVKQAGRLGVTCGLRFILWEDKLTGVALPCLGNVLILTPEAAHFPVTGFRVQTRLWGGRQWLYECFQLINTNVNSTYVLKQLYLGFLNILASFSFAFLHLLQTVLNILSPRFSSYPSYQNYADITVISFFFWLLENRVFHFSVSA